MTKISSFFHTRNSSQRSNNLKNSRLPNSRPSSNLRPYNSRTMYILPYSRNNNDSQHTRKTRNSKVSAHNHEYDLSFNIGRTAVQAPAIKLPVINLSSSRLVSGLMILSLAILIFFIWTSPSFSVIDLEITGNNRVNSDLISIYSDMVGKSIVTAIPEQIELNLHAGFPEFKHILVNVRFPNRILIEVEERIPVISWLQDDVITWIDREGVAFMPRGEAGNLVQVTALGPPISSVIDSPAPTYEQSFISPKVVQAILNLAPFVPSGMVLFFDPKYGIGWQDPHGWVVHVGLNTENLQMKLSIYQSLIERLQSQNIQPSLINMEYLNAPYYK